MLNRTKLIVALGAAGIALASASTFAREDALPRGADNRPGNIRMAHGADDPAKAPVTTNAPALRGNDNVPGDRNGNKNLPDDNNNNRGGAGGKGGADDPAGHH
jgi:hypothetical protein